MSNVTNLRRFKKQAARDAKRTQGEQNAARTSQTKAERLLRATQDDKTRKMLDQHRIEDQ